MCGIAATTNVFDAPMVKQTHRGPNHEGFYSMDNVALSHNRLSILDLTEAGNQPMENTRYVISYNGEWYNFKDYYPNHTSDTAALLQSITEVGLNATLSRMIGMFAFVLYDKLLEQLHLVVDRMGEKPCYYYHSGNTFAVASSPAALLHLQQKWSINTTALESYWKLGAVMYDSIWDGIKRVNGSHHVTYDIENNKVTSQRYWDPKFQNNTNGIEDLILDSIQRVKVADVPVFIFLSGGVDSSLVASQFVGGNAIHMDGPEYKYAKEAADRFGITLHNVSPKQFNTETALADYSLKSGEPTMAGIIPWITSSEASKLCKVAVSANGADELFFGYDRTSDSIGKIQLAHIFRNLPGVIPYDSIDDRISSGRWLELQTYIQHDLNKTLDFASMCHSLEVRSPFLDYRLVEMALSMKPEQIGRKTILKSMLHRMGFSKGFTGRPKLGFSLYVKPEGLQQLQSEALSWCINEKYLVLLDGLGKRDMMYLEASALGFYNWWKVWEEIIK